LSLQQTSSSQSNSFEEVEKASALVIGSGVAGLAAAIRLAVKGYRVEVFEKNSYPGGKLSWFEQEGYHFDAGPSLFTQPRLIEELFQAAGEPIEQYFSYQQVPVSCHYFWENGKQVKAFFDQDLLANELQLQLGEHPSVIKNYLKKAERSYRNIGPLFLDYSLHKKSTFLNRGIWKALLSSRFNHLFRSLHQYNTAQFAAPETVQLFNSYATYNGSNPYKAPGMLSMIPHLEMNEGTFYPTGGMIEITNALYALAKKKGVQFHFNTPVQRIINQGGQVQGIVAGGENRYAAIVVSNADVYFTYKNLLGDEAGAAKTLKQERSSSALIFYWGIRNSFPQLGLHNIFFSKDYRQEFEHLFKRKTFAEDVTVYINITSKLEAEQAPPGCENWFVMVNAPSIDQQDWAAMQQQVRQQVVDKLSRMLGTDIAPLIETERVLTPPQIEALTASYAGSLYGTSSNSRMAAFWRHPNFSKRIKGLYFVGGSVHPGGGIPLCLRSAKIVANSLPDSFNRKID
jgi:phytoene desaturase